MTKTQRILIETLVCALMFLAMCIAILSFAIFVMDERLVSAQINTSAVICQAEIEETTPIQLTKIIPPPKPKTQEETINSYIKEITSKYKNVKPELVMSIIYHESRYSPNVSNGKCVGLMQVSTYWHAGRAEKLGVTDFYDPYSNVLVGVDYISELVEKYEDPTLVLMLYSMKNDDAFKMYNKGKISYYAKSVLATAETYKKGE